MIDGRPYQLKVGEVYELNNQKQHSVMNRGSDDRITFIFDYVPPGPLAVDPQPKATSGEPESIRAVIEKAGIRSK